MARLLDQLELRVGVGRLRNSVGRVRVDRGDVRAGALRPLEQQRRQLAAVGADLDRHRAGADRVEAGRQQLADVGEGIARLVWVCSLRVGLSSVVGHESERSV